MRVAFIGGCQRSGTTMLASMIGTNSQVLVVPEAQFICDTYNEKNFDKYDLMEKFNLILNNKYFKLQWGFNAVEENEIKMKISKIGTYRELVELIVYQYAKRVNKENYTMWVTHDPYNITNAHILRRFFPDAKFIHIIRDGRAVALSFKNVDFGPSTTYYSAKEWKKQVNLAFTTQYLIDDKNNFINVKYEDIILKTKEELTKISEFLCINYENQMLTGSGYVKPKVNNSIHKIVGKSPDLNRVSDWENKLTEKEIAIFEHYSNGLLKLLDYEVKYGYYKMNLFDKISTLGKRILYQWVIKPFKLYRRERKIDKLLS